MARATSSKARSKGSSKPSSSKKRTKAPAKAAPAARKTTASSKAPAKASSRASETPAPAKAAPPIGTKRARPLEGSGTMHACWIITLRVLLGWSMLWAFLDKTFGLGFATSSANAWIRGGSPTTGYLSNVGGTFSGLFQSMAGSAVVDWLFMLGLLGVGISFVFGVKTRLGGIAGAAMLMLMYLAALPLTNNPFVDDHLVYAVLFLAIGFSNYKHRFDVVRNWWLSTGWVRNHPWCA